MSVPVRILAATVAGLAACGGGGVQTGPPLADPASIAAAAREVGVVGEPSRVRFEWEYGDEKGTLRGEGVGRINPPDLFRLDFFTSGEGAMAAVLVEDSLSTLGQIEDVQLPVPAFLYAMAGVFRPGLGEPDRGYEGPDGEVLVYERLDGPTRLYYLIDGRIMKVEESRNGRIVRRIELEWDEDATWPRKAEYRDNLAPSRARWELVEVRSEPAPYPRGIYELGQTP